MNFGGRDTATAFDGAVRSVVTDTARAIVTGGRRGGGGDAFRPHGHRLLVIDGRFALMIDWSGLLRRRRLAHFLRAEDGAVRVQRHSGARVAERRSRNLRLAPQISVAELTRLEVFGRESQLRVHSYKITN